MFCTAFLADLSYIFVKLKIEGFSFFIFAHFVLKKESSTLICEMPIANSCYEPIVGIEKKQEIKIV